MSMQLPARPPGNLAAGNLASWTRRIAPVAAGLALLAASLVLPPAAAPAQAEVRFGRNVRVGGHDFSNQRFNRNRRAVIHIYDRTPARPGCVWRADGRGGKVKLCHLRRIRR